MSYCSWANANLNKYVYTKKKKELYNDLNESSMNSYKQLTSLCYVVFLLGKTEYNNIKWNPSCCS